MGSKGGDGVVTTVARALIDETTRLLRELRESEAQLPVSHELEHCLDEEYREAGGVAGMTTEQRKLLGKERAS